MNFLRKMERKFGKYAIPNLMYYIILMYGAGLVIYLINPMIYFQYLSLNMEAILHGQIWRLVTFLICPPATGGNPITAVLFGMIAISLYYFLGRTLEQAWGTFCFNLYFLMGILGHILAAFIFYFISKVWLGIPISIPLTTYYLNNSLFLAFAATFPNMVFQLYFVLPIKASWLGIFIGAEFLYNFIFGGITEKVCIGLSLLNFIVFFLMTRNYRKISPAEIKRKKKFKSDMKAAQVQKVKLTHHRCAVCGRTEKDDPNLEFRYCSKCEGGLEYCMDHLYTHKHVTKGDLEGQREEKGQN